MKRILTFEFDDEEDATYDIVTACFKTSSALADYDEWLRSRIKYGFDAHELKIFAGLTSEQCIDCTIEMARDRLWEYLNEKV